MDGYDLSTCIFGVIPLGTGNDLSNALGFGGSIPIGPTLESLASICVLYANAIETKIDVWQLKIQLSEREGMIITNTKEGKKIQKDSKGNRVQIFMKSFINYISLGYDARVGFGFEKSRSASRFCNKMIYCWEGCKKNCCRKTIRVKGFLKSFQVMIPLKLDTETKSDDEVQNRSKGKQEEEKILSEKRKEEERTYNCFMKQDSYYYSDTEHLNLIKKKETLNRTLEDNQYEIKDIFIVDDEDDEGIRIANVVLKGDPVNLVCQNINYYMGGTADIWLKSTNSLGVEIVHSKNTKEDQEIEWKKTIEKIGVEKQQSFNDQKLEFFTYDNGLTVGMEKVVTGLADKVYSGAGPILIKFKDTPSYTENDRTNRIYLNVDGEFFHIVKPISLRIRLNTKIMNGQIPFLRFNDSFSSN